MVCGGAGVSLANNKSVGELSGADLPNAGWARHAPVMRRLTISLLCVAIPVLYAQTQARVTARPEASHVQKVSFSTDDGAILHGDIYGCGDRGIVLAHGGQFTKESWRPQAEQLAQAGFHVLAFDFRGFGQSHGPGESDMFTAPMYRDVLAAVRLLRTRGAKDVTVIGASFGGTAAADASIMSGPGEIDRLILLAAKGNGPAESIKSPLLEIVARDDVSSEGPGLPQIRAWFDKVTEPKKLIVIDGSAHAQFLFRTDQGGRVMVEMLRFLDAGRD